LCIFSKLKPLKTSILTGHTTQVRFIALFDTLRDGTALEIYFICTRRFGGNSIRKVLALWAIGTILGYKGLDLNAKEVRSPTGSIQKLCFIFLQLRQYNSTSVSSSYTWLNELFVNFVLFLLLKLPYCYQGPCRIQETYNTCVPNPSYSDVLNNPFCCTRNHVFSLHHPRHRLLASHTVPPVTLDTRILWSCPPSLAWWRDNRPRHTAGYPFRWGYLAVKHDAITPQTRI